MSMMNYKSLYFIESESNHPNFMKIVMEITFSQNACRQRKANLYGFARDAKKLDCAKNAWVCLYKCMRRFKKIVIKTTCHSLPILKCSMMLFKRIVVQMSNKVKLMKEEWAYLEMSLMRPKTQGVNRGTYHLVISLEIP